MIEQAALNLQRQGYSLVLLKEGTKEARFSGYQKRSPPTRAEIQHWMRREKLNIGILLKGLTIIDIDGPDGQKWADDNGLVSPMETVTSRGFHRFFQGRAVETNVIQYRAKMVDILVNGFITAPPSWIAKNEWRYQWKSAPVPRSELPTIPEGIITVPKREIILSNHPALTRPSVIRNPEKYVLSVTSHQGSFGSRGLVRAVLILRDAGKTMQEAFAYLKEVWNQPPRVVPPWSDHEIAKCIERHYQL